MFQSQYRLVEMVYVAALMEVLPKMVEEQLEIN